MDDLRNLLHGASEEERQGLATILGGTSTTPDELIKTLTLASQSVAGAFWAGLTDGDPSYLDLIRKVAAKVGVDFDSDRTVQELEVRIARKMMLSMLDRMTSEQRRELETRLQAMARQIGKGGLFAGATVTFSALTAAQLSGFGVYLLASTTLAGLTGAVGFTLPFAAYTAMSSAIAVAIGPVGWIGAGLLFLNGLSGPNYSRLAAAVLCIATIRSSRYLEEAD